MTICVRRNRTSRVHRQGPESDQQRNRRDVPGRAPRRLCASTVRTRRCEALVTDGAHVWGRGWLSTVAAIVTVTLLLVGLVAPLRQVHALDAGVDLGLAESFSVLSGANVVSTGATDLSADLGGSVASSFDAPGVVRGVTHFGGAAWTAAVSAVESAYLDAANPTRAAVGLAAGELGGLTFTPGVYHSIAAMSLTGTVTLDAGGARDAVFIFRTDGALNTAAPSSVTLVNGASASNVYWQAAGAVGIAAGASFSGTILTTAAITVGAGATLTGRALSSNGTITLAGNTIVTPPRVTITGGATVFTEDTTPTISGTSDAGAGTTVTVTLAGQTMTPTIRADGTWSDTATVVPAGTFLVVASVTALAGNTTTARQTLVIGATTPVALGRAGSFSVLAGGAVTNTLSTSLTADLGASVAPAEGSGIVVVAPGVTYFGADPVRTWALADLTLAYADAAGRTPTVHLAGNLNEQTRTPGVYRSAAALGLTGTLTLDGGGDPNAVFIFQIGGAFTPAASSEIVLINEASASNVFWQVAGAVTIGASSSFSGTILTAAAITVGDGATLTGRALSSGDAITLASNAVTTVGATAGALTISVPVGTAVLGTFAPAQGGGQTVQGPLGTVTVDDTRGGSSALGWVAHVSTTAFTSGGASIPASNVSYSVRAITQIRGGFDLAFDDPVNLATAVSAVTATTASGNNAALAAWTPTMTVLIPASAVAGVYTATVTYTVV